MQLPSNPIRSLGTPSSNNDNARKTFSPGSSSVSLGKEKELISEEKILEEVRASIETEIAKEVKEAGVEEIKETIELPQKLKKETGAMEVGEGVVIPKKPTLKLPLDDQGIKKAIKTARIIDSVLWLAHWCLRQIKIVRFKALRLMGLKVTENRHS